MSNPMTALRRGRTLFGLVAVWLFACQMLLGGLAMARILPEQHVAALTGQSLCQPGDSGAPQAPDHDHRECQLCPHISTGAALPAPAPLPGPVQVRPVTPAHAAPRPAAAPASKPDVRSAGPRAPPARG